MCAEANEPLSRRFIQAALPCDCRKAPALCQVELLPFGILPVRHRPEASAGRLSARIPVAPLIWSPPDIWSNRHKACQTVRARSESHSTRPSSELYPAFDVSSCSSQPALCNRPLLALPVRFREEGDCARVPDAAPTGLRLHRPHALFPRRGHQRSCALHSIGGSTGCSLEASRSEGDASPHHRGFVSPQF